MIAFARKEGNIWALTIVPRFSREFSDKKGQWKDIILALPADAPTNWKNVITSEELSINSSLALDKVFDPFPVACLVSQSS